MMFVDLLFIVRGISYSRFKSLGSGNCMGLCIPIN